MADKILQSYHAQGFDLQYSVEGDGPTAIVVGSALYYARTFSQELRKSLKLVFMDHRGFAPGNNCEDLSQYGLDVLVDDIEGLRKHLGLGQVIIVGHSGHAFMALEYAKKYPENVSHVVMINVAPDYSHESHAAGERYLQESVSPERKAYLGEQMGKLPQEMERAPEKAFITYCLLTGAKSWYDYTFDAAPLWDGIETNMSMFNHVWGEIFRDIDISVGLDTLDKPVFLALGRYDFLVPPAYLWEPLRDHFHDLTVRVFEKSSHAPHYEEPQAFDRELLGWLQEK